MPVEVSAIVEARDKLPASERAAVEERLTDARRRLNAAGLTGQLADLRALDKIGVDVLAWQYFEAGARCPFLSDAEECVIYADRPLSCRVYLVTSDPAHCQDSSGDVRQVMMRDYRPLLCPDRRDTVPLVVAIGL
jgi:Fe-S-cluster containining protein